MYYRQILINLEKKINVRNYEYPSEKGTQKMELKMPVNNLINRRSSVILKFYIKDKTFLCLGLHLQIGYL